jgi:hypothetical protein
LKELLKINSFHRSREQPFSNESRRKENNWHKKDSSIFVQLKLKNKKRLERHNNSRRNNRIKRGRESSNK